ncbi:MAG TPA: hypothetical protein VLE97_09620 [Gaiellaceae bacterium]|nr:hypothetical protein [Gaiellaceae bacterium]
MTDDKSAETAAPGEPKKRRRVVFVEYDVTDMSDAQVHALLLALASSRQASFHVEVDP